MAQWVQIDLLDAIAEAEALQRKKDGKTKELCTTWKNALKNENGVYNTYMIRFPAGSFKSYFMELKLALAFPYVYGDVDYQCGSPDYYGHGSPVDGENDLIQFNVYDDPKDVESYLLRTIKASLDNNPNINSYQNKHLPKLKLLVNDVVEKAMAKLTEEKQEDEQ